jgi:hypothetical protein
MFDFEIQRQRAATELEGRKSKHFKSIMAAGNTAGHLSSSRPLTKFQFWKDGDNQIFHREFSPQTYEFDDEDKEEDLREEDERVPTSEEERERKIKRRLERKEKIEEKRKRLPFVIAIKIKGIPTTEYHQREKEFWEKQGVKVDPSFAYFYCVGDSNFERALRRKVFPVVKLVESKNPLIKPTLPNLCIGGFNSNEILTQLKDHWPRAPKTGKEADLPYPTLLLCGTNDARTKIHPWTIGGEGDLMQGWKKPGYNDALKLYRENVENIIDRLLELGSPHVILFLPTPMTAFQDSKVRRAKVKAAAAEAAGSSISLKQQVYAGASSGIRQQLLDIAALAKVPKHKFEGRVTIFDTYDLFISQKNDHQIDGTLLETEYTMGRSKGKLDGIHWCKKGQVVVWKALEEFLNTWVNKNWPRYFHQPQQPKPSIAF